MITLTPMERTLLLHLAQGEVLERVRKEMGLSNKSFNLLRLGLFNKLGVNDRAAAVSRALIYGLLSAVERLRIVATSLDNSILEKVAQGWRDGEIERRLHCTNGDIVECIRRALDICKVTSRAELVRLLRAEGYGVV